MAVKMTAEAAGAPPDELEGEKPARTPQSVKLPEPLRQRLKLWAVFLNKEISQLVEEAVAARLDELDRERAARGLAPLPTPHTELEAQSARRNGRGSRGR